MALFRSKAQFSATAVPGMDPIPEACFEQPDFRFVVDAKGM
jgi:hypothetical protein